MGESQSGTTCPAKSIEMNTPDSPVLTHFRMLDECQDEARPVFHNTEAGVGYWVFTDNAVILDGLQHPELWSSSVIVPTDPEPPYKWIPIMIDPPDHAKWRQVLAEYFSPGRVKGLRDAQQAGR
jgi:cytochrome P450